MSIVNAIYKAPIVRKAYCDIEGTTHIVIKYNGKYYGGWACTNDSDKEFFSKKVGKNIALSRARLKAMKAELKRCDTEYRERKIFADLRTDLLKDHEMSLLINRSKWRCESLRLAIKREKNNLAKYIEGQDKAIQSVKKMREKVKID